MTPKLNMTPSTTSVSTMKAPEAPRTTSVIPKTAPEAPWTTSDQEDTAWQASLREYKIKAIYRSCTLQTITASTKRTSYPIALGSFDPDFTRFVAFLKLHRNAGVAQARMGYDNAPRVARTALLASPGSPYCSITPPLRHRSLATSSGSSASCTYSKTRRVTM